MALGLHGPAAAGAAVADGVEPAEHGLLEEGVVHVAPGVLLLEDAHGLFLGDGPGAAGIVLQDERGEGLAHDEADAHRLAVLFADHPAGAVQERDALGVLEHDVPGQGVGHHLLQIAQLHGPVHAHQPGGLVQGHGLAVVGVGPVRMGFVLGRKERPVAGQEQDQGQEQERGEAAPARGDADVEIGPAGVGVAVEQLGPGQAFGAALLEKGPGRGPQCLEQQARQGMHEVSRVCGDTVVAPAAGLENPGQGMFPPGLEGWSGFGVEGKKEAP